MVSSQACTTFASSSRTLIPLPKRIRVAIQRPSYLKKAQVVVPKLPNLDNSRRVSINELNKLSINVPMKDSSPMTAAKDQKDDITTVKLYAILEAVSDRIEMHHNIKEQRQNWNSLLLNSVNMISLTAVTMAGLSGAFEHDTLALKVSSMLLFSAATGILLIMNKIQPSQLVEEQRNAVRLFKQLKTKIQNAISLRSLTEKDVEDAMEEVLALDRAYPLPLLGAMLDKFPQTLKPAVWWPTKKSSNQNELKKEGNNGWSEELEGEMRDIVEVIMRKDIEDYVRLGNKALKFNKMLAVSGPLLTGIAALGAGFAGIGAPWGGLVAAVAGSLASVVSTIEHGGQVGMVFEMYRNCAGSFRLLEETVESNLKEENLGRRENGELFEMKMALHLGRSLSELRDLADKSRRNGGVVDEFASKLL